MKNLAIIPARSGSKGLTNKNIKLLNKKPLIAYTIEAALNSQCFDKIIVSTDSEDYAKIAKECGAEVPFLRPEHLSGDEVATNDVIIDLLIKLKENGQEFDCLMILQPTSPLRTSEDIKKAFKLMKEKKANAVISLCEVDHSPMYTGQVPEDLRIDGFIKKGISYRRQELPKYYRLNGAIYLSKVEYFIKYQDLYRENCYAYLMDKRRSIDIDDEVDFNFAKEMLTIKHPKQRKIGENRPIPFYCGKKDKLKAIVLGCDPSTEDHKVFSMVFNLSDDKGRINFRNQYFSSIYLNLLHLFANNIDEKQLLQEEAISEKIYVQNLCKDYLEHETSYYKDNWVKWINTETVYIEALKKELDLIDPQQNLPVLLTAEVLIETLILKERGDQYSLRMTDYYNNRCRLINAEDNKLGRILIPLTRSTKYRLADYREYCDSIKRVLTK